MNRRTFAKNAALLAGAAVSFPLISACGNFTRPSFNKYCVKDFKLGLPDDMYEILCLASLAPSSHNTQPWIIKIKKYNDWILRIDKKRLLPEVDPDSREMLLSLGAFLENLVTAAGIFGYNAAINITAQTLNDFDFARIAIAEYRTVPFPIEKMKMRRTVRSEYLNKELKAGDFKYMISGSNPNIHYYPPASKESKYLQEGTSEAFRAQTMRDAAQKELSEWIRWSNFDVEKNMDGLTPASMDISGLSGWYARSFYDKEDIMSEDFRQKSIDKTTEQAKNNGGWVVISSDDDALTTLIETGRIFERMLLRIKDYNIALQPMSQMLEESPWKNEVAKELGLNRVQFILRTGYVEDYPEPVSPRRPVPWFAEPL